MRSACLVLREVERRVRELHAGAAKRGADAVSRRSAHAAEEALELVAPLPGERELPAVF